MPRNGWGRTLGVGLALCIGLGAVGMPVLARGTVAPAARYHGTVSYYGRPAPVGALVSVHAGAQVVATASVTLTDGLPAYELTVAGDDPTTPEKEGPAENETLSFRVNGVPADQATMFHAMDDRLLPLAVTRMAICVGAYEDQDRDGAHDEAEPWLAGVTINVLRLRTDLSYLTTGRDEPACHLFVAEDKEVRAVDWPAQVDPPSGQGQPAVRLTQHEGVFTVLFPFVRLTSGGNGPPTTTPATPTATPEVFPGPTGQTPLPTVTAVAGITGTWTPEPDTATPPSTPVTALTPASATPVGAETVLTVDSADDPGAVGDSRLTFREALRLATGDLAPALLSAAERSQLSGPVGPGVRDVIRFDPLVFPPEGRTTIYVQSPAPSRGTADKWVSAVTVCRPVFWGPPQPGLPPLSAGNDTIDGRGAGVTLSGEFGADLFDGLVINSDGNTVRGLGFTNFNAALLLYGNARFNTLGGTLEGAGLVVGQSIAGVVFHGAGVEGNRLLGSVIGADAEGETAAGNATHGVLVAGGAHDNQIGAPGAGNLIADSAGDGVAVVGGGTRRNRVQANRVGTNAGGNRAIANTTGVGVGCGAADNLVGGAGPGEGNLISGNSAEGLWVLSPDTQGTRILGNRIGVTDDGLGPLPNQGAGVLISDGARQTEVGGVEPGAGNLIARNFGPGVRVVGAATVANTVRRNRITANAGGGISLEGGANGNLAAPILTSVEDGTVRGLAAAGAVVEIYSDPGREGAWFEVETRADAAGWFRTKLPAAPRGQNLNALALDAAGNTSPFGGSGQPPTATSTGEPSPTPSQTPEPLARSTSYFPILLNGHTFFAKLSLVPDAATLPMGGLLTLDLRIDGAEELFGLQLALDFPADRLEVIDADPATVGVQILPGDFPDPGRLFIVENAVNNGTGVISYAFTLVEGPPANGDGVVARIRFRGRGPGPARVAFREAMLSNANAESLRALAVGALLNVLPPPTGVPPSATPEPSATPLPTLTRTPTATLPPTLTPTPTNTALPSDTPSLTPTPSDTPVPSLTPIPSDTPLPSITPTASDTVVPSETLPPTATFTPSASPVASNTPMATHTAPPTVTAVPTSDPCSRPVVNPGFESDAAWVLSGARPPRYTGAMAHSGQRSLFLGIAPNEPNQYSYSSTWQPVVVPQSARTLRVSAWAYQVAEPGGGPDRQMLLVYDVDPAANGQLGRPPMAMVFSERMNAQVWQRRALTLDVSAWRGRTLWLYSAVVNDGFGGRAYMVLDDTEMAFCP